SMRTIRIVIADDDRFIRKSLKTLLRIEEDIEVVGEAADGSEAVVLIEELEPDVALVDVEMPDMNGIETTRRIKQCRPHSRVVVFSVYDTARMEAWNAGADGFLLKDCGRAMLVEAIRGALPVL